MSTSSDIVQASQNLVFFKVSTDIPDEVFESNITSEDEVWLMFFNGASRIGPKGKIIAGVGVVFISPQNHVLPRAFSLTDHVPTMWQNAMLYLLAFSSLMK